MGRRQEDVRITGGRREERGKVKEDRFFNVGRKMHEGNKRGMSER